MVSITKPNAPNVESRNYREIAAIERVLKSSFGQSERTADKGAFAHDALHFSLNFENADALAQSKPCLDQNHHVSLIDVTGPSAAAIVEFTDCKGASFSDLYVLQKEDDEWAISRKVWDSHAHD